MNLQGEGGLFSPDLVQGDLSTIAPVVAIVKTISVWVISLIGLMITISTVLKQALHGLYATNPKFWDKVDDAHMANFAQAWGNSKQGNEISAKLGFVFSFGLGLLPNVKKMTEFDDYNTDPKTFFTKSLPIACLYLFIGVFIFYGYTTKFGAYVSEFGTEVLDAFFLSVDPIELASKVPTSIAKRVKVPSDSAKDDFSKSVNDAYKNVYRAVNTLLKDIDDSRNQDVALAVEAWCSQCLQEVIGETNKGNFKQTFRATLVPNALNLSTVQGSSANGVTVHAWQTPLSTFNTGSAMAQADTYFVVLEFESTAIGAVKESTTFDCTMTGGEWTVNSNNYEATLDLGTLPSSGSLSGGSNISGTVNGESAQITITGSKLTVKAKKGSLNCNEITGISGLSYSINGEMNKITRIVFNTNMKGSSITFSSNNGGTKGDWKFGEAPQKQNAEDQVSGGNSGTSGGTGGNTGNVGSNSGSSGGNSSNDDDGDLFND